MVWAAEVGFQEGEADASGYSCDEICGVRHDVGLRCCLDFVGVV